jgi:hypothetical protein
MDKVFSAYIVQIYETLVLNNIETADRLREF